MKLTQAQKQFRIDDALIYVETLEKTLTRAAEQNAYHAIVEAWNANLDVTELRERYNKAVDKIERRPYLVKTFDTQLDIE